MCSCIDSRWKQQLFQMLCMYNNKSAQYTIISWSCTYKYDKRNLFFFMVRIPNNTLEDGILLAQYKHHMTNVCPIQLHTLNEVQALSTCTCAFWSVLKLKKCACALRCLRAEPKTKKQHTASPERRCVVWCERWSGVRV